METYHRDRGRSHSRYMYMIVRGLANMDGAKMLSVLNPTFVENIAFVDSLKTAKFVLAPIESD